MSDISAYRASVLASLGCYLLWILFPYAYPIFHNELEINLLQEIGGYQAILVLPASVAWLIVAVWVVLAWAMWHFWRRARICYLGMAVFTGLLTLTEGFRVQSPIEAFLLDVTLMFDGAVLALAYFSTVRHEFEKTPAT